MMRIIKIALLICIPVTVLRGGYTADYSLSQFSFIEENGFDRIRARGFTFIGEPGTPELPSIYLNYIIPPDAKIESLIILQSNISEIAGQFLVYPIQPPVVSGETVPWVPPDTLIYNSDNIYPTDFIRIASEGVMDGARIVTVVVHPIQYRPASQRLFIVTNINFEFIFSPNTIPEVRPHIRGEYEQTVYDAMLKQTVENDYEIPAYYQKPSIVEVNQLGQLAPFPMGPAIIIADPMFADAFQPYADWLTDQGIRAHIISPALIYAYFTGVDEAERIRNYIKYCYEHGGGTYFILGGMDSRFNPPIPPQLPTRRCFCVDILPYPPHSPHYDTIPCDHYFCALDGNWNADGDDTWGEMNDDVDQFPEVYVGRVLCRNVQEVQNWVEKALVYERSPANINSLDTVVWIHQSTWFMGNAIYEFPAHFTHIIDTNPTAFDAFNLFNHGYGFTNAQTHGTILCFPTGYDDHWIQAYWERQPSPDNPDAGLNWSINDNKYYIHYAVSCNTGFFDDPNLPCVAESFTTRYRNYETDIPVGACASIEHTRYSLYPSSHTLQKEYYESLFTLEYPGASFSMIGFSLAEAKTQMSWGSGYHRWVCYATNLFGSPTTPAWTNVPGNFIVSHPSRIPVGQQTQFVVQVEDGEGSNEPVAYAKVCLHKPGDIYAIKKTDDDGRATFFITPRTTGILKVTVTRFHNDGESYTQYLPSQTTCRVLDYPGGGQTLDSDDIAPDHLCIVQMPTFIIKDAVRIKFGIAEENQVDFTIYDITGSQVKTVKSGILPPGYYEEKIDTGNLSNGVYFIVLRQGSEKISKKFLLIK